MNDKRTCSYNYNYQRKVLGRQQLFLTFVLVLFLVPDTRKIQSSGYNFYITVSILSFSSLPCRMCFQRTADGMEATGRPSTDMVSPLPPLSSFFHTDFWLLFLLNCVCACTGDDLLTGHLPGVMTTSSLL